LKRETHDRQENEMDPVSSSTTTTSLQGEMSKIVEAFGTEFMEMMMNQLQQQYNENKQALNDEMNG
jgi:hypothetical protein